jgi:hypothetical protein
MQKPSVSRPGSWPRILAREQTAQLLVSPKYHCVSRGKHPVSLLSQSWTLLKSALNDFIEDEALTRGAAIAFYTATSFAPVLLIVIAIAGLVYGQQAAQGAITTQLGDLMVRYFEDSRKPRG